MKRVYCLYRVSTLGQVEKDDIPMQKKSCHEFVEKNLDWKIAGEFSEKGISGFKVSAKDRDAIQDLQKAAIEEKFDVLLVFMFDRIGRKEDETPFVVEWFVQHGVEVWSVNEGQQRFDNHVDKLLNYIRYWQASGESIKTSIRTKTRMGQIVQEGHFKGGGAPFGYRLVHKGRLNKKGHEVYDLEIDEEEASVVRLIFDRHSNAGMGPQTIAAYLTREGIRSRSGDSFVAPSIRNIVSNPAYRGVLRSGESVSEPFEHLRIIDDETFFRSQRFIEQRSAKYQESRRIPKKTTENCLLTGNIFCGHCGARLVTSTAGKKRVRKDGSVYDRRYWRYLCYNRMRHKDKCCGQSGYTATRIDEAVTGIVRDILAALKKVPLSSIVGKRHEAETRNMQGELTAAQRALQKKTDNLGALKAEVVKAIRGESSFGQDLLNEMIGAAESERDDAEQLVTELTERLAESKSMIQSFREQHNLYVSWAEIFDGCEVSVRKMIICQLIDQVTVSAGYRIEVKLNVTLEQYMGFSEQDVILCA
ncbi:MAG: recombinase family protein [Clostridiales Family XIII bacterium]|nr:recombinase family protein [Clostridiales Family XIII bacterium]